MPLGLFREAEYAARRAVIPRGGALLVYTDGLTDSMRGDDPTNRLREVLADSSRGTMFYSEISS